jgi:hypothetical protein
MGGVDNINKNKKIGGLFGKNAMFKKWYVTGLIGLFDFVLVNGQMACNMSVTDKHDIFVLGIDQLDISFL